MLTLCGERRFDWSKGKMAELGDVTLYGRPLQSLRVADLKAALEERGLSKSGQKNELVKRLKGALVLENLQRTSTAQSDEKNSQHCFIKQYLTNQREFLRKSLERKACEAFQTNDQEDHAEVNNSTLFPPQAQCVITALAEQHTSPGPSGEGLFGAGNEGEGNNEADTSGPPASGSVTMPVSSGDHQPMQGCISSEVAADSHYSDNEDGEEDADDDDWDISARRRNLRESTIKDGPRESYQSQQHYMPSPLSPQRRKPTPPPSSPLELSFPLPDTPKQSPHCPDVTPGKRSPSSGSSSNGSRSSSPETQRIEPTERGPLTLLAHKMERELALEQERVICSQARLGRGSPLCEQLREQIVQQFKNNISQRTIARNLGIPPSTVHRIIKRFRESGEISVRKGQGRKPTLNARDLRSLRRHCIKNQHHSVKDRTTWAQEHFGKPLSVNTVRRYIYKCKLLQSESHISTTLRNDAGFSEPELI